MRLCPLRISQRNREKNSRPATCRSTGKAKAPRLMFTEDDAETHKGKIGPFGGTPASDIVAAWHVVRAFGSAWVAGHGKGSVPAGRNA